MASCHVALKEILVPGSVRLSDSTKVVMESNCSIKNKLVESFQGSQDSMHGEMSVVCNL